MAEQVHMKREGREFKSQLSFPFSELRVDHIAKATLTVQIPTWSY